MGVCCIVFDIDGIFFEFCMNFLNIEKNKINFLIFFNISCFLRVSCYFQHKKKLVYKKFAGGGGVEFFFRKQLFLPSFRPSVRPSITFSLLVKWEVVSPNTGSRQGQLESISIISSIPLFWICISNVEGGVMFFSHFMLFPTFLETKLGIQNNYFSFNVFFVFFCMLEILKSAPSLTATG